ncbi:MAG: type II secretion system protein [Sedimentisphaerales bacterium]|nr:type II secretion system protein [Sedimentisphaerales bacterium]
MKSIVRKTKHKAAFTIVELLTVMSIIVILIGLLVPALNQVRKFAREVRQRAQFNSISVAIELFNSEFDQLPDSSATDSVGTPYCGAMKLAEAMVGQDLMGFHPDSVFRSDGTDYDGRRLYTSGDTGTGTGTGTVDTTARKGPYLPIENANAYRLADIYNDTGSFESAHFVLCDVFGRVKHRGTGKSIGMPILYYKANTANTSHNINNPDDPDNIYDYMDNQQLLLLGKPWDPPGSAGGTAHKLATEGGAGKRFYLNTWNTQVTTRYQPYRKDTYILMSAGNDGEFGTADDICNYDWKYQEIP